MNDNNYIIFNVTEIDTIDFSEVIQKSSSTLRYSIDESKAIVKYSGSMPSSVVSLIYKEGPYSHSEILSILQSMEWTYIEDEEEL